METLESAQRPKEIPAKARSVLWILYVAMAILILLPLVVIWLTGAIQF